MALLQDSKKNVKVKQIFKLKVSLSYKNYRSASVIHWDPISKQGTFNPSTEAEAGRAVNSRPAKVGYNDLNLPTKENTHLLKVPFELNLTKSLTLHPLLSEHQTTPPLQSTNLHKKQLHLSPSQQISAKLNCKSPEYRNFFKGLSQQKMFLYILKPI